MSEFYSIRRGNITDMSALFGFLIGFVGAAPFAYDFLRVGFETQHIVKGFTYFITITFGAGVLVAIAGLAVGRGLGWFWESGHRVVRRARGQEFALEDLPASQRPVAKPRPVAVPAYVAGEAPRVQYTDAVDAPAFAQLLHRAAVPDVDEARTAAALRRTINIGAWDGERLVGAVRVLSDGYQWWVVTDIVVDPVYRRRGIGRELMRRARDRSSGTLLVVRIPPGVEGFFRAVAVSPEHEGFLRGAKARVH